MQQKIDKEGGGGGKTKDLRIAVRITVGDREENAPHPVRHEEKVHEELWCV